MEEMDNFQQKGRTIMTTKTKINPVDESITPIAAEFSTEAKIRIVCNDLAEFLIKKNEAYGDSAINPCRIFSKAGSTEQIKVRIDDKLNRLMQGHNYADEDTVQDLLGYLVLLKVSEMEDIEDGKEERIT